MNKAIPRDIPKKYRQPDDMWTGRVMLNEKEIITFSEQSHVRIWYNNQTDGYPLHSHEAFEVCINIQNKYRIVVNAEEYCLSEGDILIIPPNAVHEYINDSYGVRFIYLIEANEFYRSHDFKSIEPLFFSGFLCNKETCPDIYDRVYGLFMEMNDAYFNRVYFWETLIYTHIYRIFTEIARHRENAAKEEGADLSHSMHRIRALMQYVDINYAEDISTEAAARFTGFSKYHFIRLFKLHTGYTFHDYLTLKRIHMASTLLMGDTAITDIAFQSGFNTLPSFCRAFKKYTGYSPSEYKKLTNNPLSQIDEFNSLHHQEPHRQLYTLTESDKL